MEDEDFCAICGARECDPAEGDHCQECGSYDCGEELCCPNGLVHYAGCSQAGKKSKKIDD